MIVPTDNKDPVRHCLLIFLLSAGLLRAAAPFEAVTFDQLEFVHIPAGSFLMGTSDEERALLRGQNIWKSTYECERPAHRVTISKPLLIGKYEITQKQWREVMEKNPSAFKDDQAPVDSVSWDEVQEFIRKLNAKTGGKYRLPTEAEWEYCCRAGGANLYGLGSNRVAITETNLADFAWYRANSENRTHPVGIKEANAFGIHDMHGNVWEWCQDWFAGDFYDRAPLQDPVNTTATTERVFRGGSWFLDAAHLRAAFRGGQLPVFKSPYVGFRLARDHPRLPDRSSCR